MPPSSMQTVTASFGSRNTVTDEADDPDPSAAHPTLASAANGTLAGRITVLPRVVSETAGALRLEPHSRSRYSTQRRLGMGAMGEVELSEDHDIGRSVALKRLPPGTDSAAAVARFVDEVRTMGSLDHPNITPIYDVGRDEDGRLFFTMKYVEGESLETIIEKLRAGDPRTHAALPIARRLDVFMGILHALDYAHAQGILHRDIKPANIMLGVHGEVRLMDWGIARRGSVALPRPAASEHERPEMTQDGALLGTPLYMSPEQARGDRDAIDERSDLYSAFVVLFELLTLRRYVREDDNLYATLREVMGDGSGWSEPENSGWVDPRQAPVPIEMRQLLRRGLQRDPEDRFESAADVLLAIESLRSGGLEVECPVTFFKSQQHRVTTLAESKPRLFMWLMALAGVGMASLLGLAGVGAAALI